MRGWLMVAAVGVSACGGSAASDTAPASAGSPGVGAAGDHSAGSAAGGGSSGGDGAVDAGGAAAVREGISAGDCFADLQQPSLGFVEVQRLRSTDDRVRVWRARERIDAPTVGETTAYALVRFWVDSDLDTGACVTDAAAMSYVYAHHNWDEHWTASTANASYQGSQLLLTGSGVNAWQDQLSATSLSGEPEWGPLTLADDGCVTLPYDLNGCTLRTRLDEPPPGWQ